MNETTDIALSIRTSGEEIDQWDRERIVASLLRETNVSEDDARKISLEVEDQIASSKIRTITSSLVREMVNSKLLEMGLEKEYLKHNRLGVPIYDVEELLVKPNRENANVPHGPEATNLTLAGQIKKEYALRKIFSKDVTTAHMEGDLHLHDLNMPDRPYSYAQSECILCKIGDKIENISFFTLFKKATFVYEEDGFEIGILPKDYQVYDKNGWVGLKRVIRHKRGNKKILFVKTRSSKSLLVTEDQHIITKSREKLIPARDLKTGDELECLSKLDIHGTEDCIDLTLEIPTKIDGNSEYYFDNLLIDEKYELSKISYTQLYEIKKEHNVRSTSKTLIYSKCDLNGSESKKYHSLIKLTSEFCYFIGVFIAEGHYETNAISFTVGPEETEKILEYLDNNGVEYSIMDKENSNCKRIRIFSKFYHDFFNSYLNIDKYSRFTNLPSQILNWKPELAFHVLSGVIDGDGDGHATGTGVILNTSSRTLINQTHHLLLTQGIKSCLGVRGADGSKRVYKGREIVQNYDLFYSSFSIPSDKKYLFKLSRKAKNIGKSKNYKNTVASIKPFPIRDEYVYDITTESGTFYCNGILSKNCSGQSLEYVKKFGLSLPKSLSIAKPAKYAEVLLAHMVKFSASLQCHYAGAIGWDAVNIFFAPFLVGLSKDRIKQIAQMLIFEFSQQAVARGGQAIFSDINLYYEIPKHFENTSAIGPGGEYTGKSYKAYEKEAQDFVWALFEVYKEGDGSGRPFMFPKPNCTSGDTDLFLKINGNYELIKLRDLSDRFTDLDSVYIPDIDIQTGEGREVKVSRVFLREKGEKLIRFNFTQKTTLDTVFDHICFVVREGGVVKIKSKDVVVGDLMIYPKTLGLGGKDYLKIETYPSIKDRKYIVETDDKFYSIKDKNKRGIPKSIIIDEDFAEILGWFISEGSTISGLQISKYKNSEKELWDKMYDKLSKVFEKVGKHDKGFYINNVLFKDFINNLGLEHTAEDKKVPDCIFKSPISVQKAFLRGLFSCDGTSPISNKFMKYTSKSKELILGIRVLLQNIGICGAVYEDKVKEYLDNLYYSIYIKGRDQQVRFMEIVGGKFNNVCKKYNNFEGNPRNSLSSFTDVSLPDIIVSKLDSNYARKKNSKGYRTWRDVFVNEYDSEISKLTDKFMFLQVESINTVRNDSYVLEVDHPQHSFIVANGILTSNCHITEKFFKTPGHEEFLVHVCGVASKMGNPYFLFDRGSTAKISECCFHHSQKVIVKTSRGIRHGRIGEICKTDAKELEVFHKGVFRKAEPVVVDYNKFVKIKLSNGYEMFITDNHTCPTVYGDKEAKDLTIDDYLPINHSEFKGFNDKENYVMGYFLGSYLGDGSLDNTSDNNNRITFSLSKLKQKVIDNIVNFSEMFGAHITVRPENDKHVIFVYITSSTLKAFIKEFIYLDKGLNNRVYEMSISFRLGIVDGLYDTDGGNSKRIYTFSDKLVKDINVLYTTLGIPVNISTDGRGIAEGKFSDNKGFTIRPYEKISKYSHRPGFKFINGKYYFQVVSTENVNFDKPIPAYCFRMKDTSNPYFTLANGIETGNCRLSFKLTDQDLDDAKYPWKMRYCALQNVTLNLPRIGLTSSGDKVFDKLTKLFDLAIKAHLQKQRFIKRELSLADKGPLALLAMDSDGEPYLKLERVSYLIGMVGLNELCKTQTGYEMHQSEESFEYGLDIIAHLNLLTKKASEEYNMHFVLEQTPAESTAYRFAKLDLKYFPDKAASIVQGCAEDESVYYTNSTYLNISADINPIDRIKKEGLFHPLIEAGALTHVWLGEAQPSPESLANFVIKIFKLTKNDQVAFSPEFTCCLSCKKTNRGLQEKCIYCGSKNIEGITRITGYFSKISGWNKGKLSELKDRYKNHIDQIC